jgi:hypothetical protein
MGDTVIFIVCQMAAMVALVLALAGLWMWLG